MTSVKCLSCGVEQDFEAVVGYCDQCGKKLPVPHMRGKTAARKEFVEQRRIAEVGAGNVVATICVALIAVLAVAFAVFVVAGAKL